MNGKPSHILLAIALWLLTMLLIVSYYAWTWLQSPLNIPENRQIFTVATGQSVTSLANKLDDYEIIRWKKLWIYYARFAELTNVKTGEYVLLHDETPVSLLKKFNQGKVIQYQLTLIEGKTFKDFVHVLEGHNKLVHLLNPETAAQQLAEYGIPIDHPEGWFYPDTYSYISGDSDVDVLSRAYNTMRVTLQEEWENRADNLPYETPYEALIMASIVEKETGAAFERKKIAGVFVRRLQKNMRLQTDPTVIYGMGDRYQGNIRRKDLKEKTPYNTYVIKGLPPTPIANPGRAAIHAALNPEAGKELYFVAKGDGTHVFSETLEQHNQAVREYQLKRRKDYRSTVN